MAAFWDFIIRFLVPALVGGAAGWAAVWFKWDVEKRRGRQQRRVELVQKWRDDLLPLIGDDAIMVLRDGGHDLTKHPTYSTIRNHLSKRFVRSIEQDKSSDGKMDIVFGGNVGLRQGLIAEIARIEKKWGLI